MHFMVRSVLLCIVQASRFLSPWGNSSVEADSGIVYGGDCPLRCVAVAVCCCSCRLDCQLYVICYYYVRDKYTVWAERRFSNVKPGDNC
jgi:hypothetical protein